MLVVETVAVVRGASYGAQVVRSFRGRATHKLFLRATPREFGASLPSRGVSSTYSMPPSASTSNGASAFAGMVERMTSRSSTITETAGAVGAVRRLRTHPGEV